MKKYLLFGFLAVMTFATSQTFMSCSNDDDDDTEMTASDSRIIGEWFEENRDYSCGWKFQSNGTCVYGEWGRGESKVFSNDPEDIGKWNINGSKLKVVFTYDDGDYDDYTFNYAISDDGQTLTLTGGDSGKAGVFTKK